MPRDRQVLARAVGRTVEMLEQRTLMSASALLDHGTLSIEGTNSADVIVVSYVPGDSSTLQVNVNEKYSTFSTRKVKRINIEAGRGDDAITINELYGAINKPATISAGRGNDTVIGGSGDDVLNLGAGDDQAAYSPGADVIDDGGGSDVYDGTAVTPEAFAARAAAKPAAVTVPTYVVTDLGIVPGGVGNREPLNVANITNSVVGYDVVLDSGKNKVTHATFKPGGTGAQQDLGTLFGTTTPGADSIAYDINIRNQIVGVSSAVAGSNSSNGFYYDPAFRTMDDVGMNNNGAARGLNDFSDVGVLPGPTIVGNNGFNGVQFSVFKRGPAGRLVRIPDSNNAAVPSRGQLNEVNNLDVDLDLVGDIMVGREVVLDQDRSQFTKYQAIVYNEATDNTTRIPLLYANANPSLRAYSEAYDVNDGLTPTSYTIVGVSGIDNQPVSATPAGTIREGAFVYRRAGGVLALPMPVGNRSAARGVSDPDVNGLVKIVGRVTRLQNSNLVDNAAMWIETATDTYQLINLQQLTVGGTGRVLQQAYAINDNGWIVASGTVPADANKHAFLLRPSTGGVNGLPQLKFSGAFIKPLSQATPATPKIVFNLVGDGDFTVGKSNVVLNLQTVSLARNQLPSEGLIDFTFPAGGISREVVNSRKGSGRFSGRAIASVTLDDGTVSDVLVSFQGTTGRVSKRDVISGTFVAISSRGKVLVQGQQNVLSGSLSSK